MDFEGRARGSSDKFTIDIAFFDEERGVIQLGKEW